MQVDRNAVEADGVEERCHDDDGRDSRARGEVQPGCEGQARLSYTLVKRLSEPLPVAVVVAALVRLLAWLLIDHARFASDEQGYVDAGIALATTGQQDLFWPPLTGWIVALVHMIAPASLS